VLRYQSRPYRQLYTFLRQIKFPKLKELKIFSKKISSSEKKELTNFIHNFDNLERMLGKGKRNVIKIIDHNNAEINIKSFKIPNVINQIVYRFFRKSKAERSFQFANKLLSLGIKTPQPLSYFEYSNLLFFKKSFYISQNLKHNLTYRELINNSSYPAYEIILRAFTHFTFQLHERGINFLDHSPGNTLIVKNDRGYDFFLIDLNRMKFETMDFNNRMNNFAKLSPKNDMLEIMADEYSKLYSKKTKEEILETMSYYSSKFSSGYNKKEQFKKRYYFWRK
jgi:hypothetical protein